MAVSATRSPPASKPPPPQTAQPAAKPKEAPKKEAPAKEAPKKEAPAKETQAKETPKKETQAKETPKKETPVRNTSGSSFEQPAQSSGKPKATSAKDSFSALAQTPGQTAGASNAAPANTPSPSASGGAGPTNTSTAKNGVTVVDDFRTSNHGVNVHNIVDGTSQATSTPIKDVQLPTITEQPNGTFKGNIEAEVVGTLNSNTKALGSVVNDPGQTKVVNQSQAISPAKVVAGIKHDLDHENRSALTTSRLNAGKTGEELLSDSLSAEEKKLAFKGTRGKELRKELGFSESETVSEKDFYQKLASHTENQFKTSPKIAEAQQRYDAQTQKLENAGILNVVAAGNDGKTVTELEKLGVKLDDRFAKNVLANDKAITVGATDKARQIADFSSPSSSVDVAIQGKGVDGGNGPYLNGTSFSAPQVAATLSDMFAANPNLTNDQARTILREASTDTSLTPKQEGQGILDPARARELAAQSVNAVPEL